MDNISLIFIREYKDYINRKIVINNGGIPINIFHSPMYQYKNFIKIVIIFLIYFKRFLKKIVSIQILFKSLYSLLYQQD